MLHGGPKIFVRNSLLRHIIACLCDTTLLLRFVEEGLKVCATQRAFLFLGKPFYYTLRMKNMDCLASIIFLLIFNFWTFQGLKTIFVSKVWDTNATAVFQGSKLFIDLAEFKRFYAIVEKCLYSPFIFLLFTLYFFLWARRVHELSNLGPVLSVEFSNLHVTPSVLSIWKPKEISDISPSLSYGLPNLLRQMWVSKCPMIISEFPFLILDHPNSHHQCDNNNLRKIIYYGQRD